MKKLFKLLFGLVALLVAAIVLVTIFVDPNDYKPEIEAQAKQALNRQLVIEGDLSWGFFPTLGISTGKVRIENPAGYNRVNLMEVESVSAGIKILPLFTANVELGQLTLDGFKLNVITDRHGKSNLDDIGKNSTTKKPQQTSGGSAPQLDSLTLAGLLISNAQIESQDLVNNTSSLLQIKEVSLGEFSLGEPADLKVIIALASDGLNGDFVLSSVLRVSSDLKNINLNNLSLESKLTGSSLPNGDLAITMASSVAITTAPLSIEISGLSLNANDIQLSGNAQVAVGAKTRVRYELNGNVWDLDQFIANSEPTAENEKAPVSEEQEPDLSFLNGLDVDGKIVIAGIKVNGLTIGKTVVRNVVKDGVAKLAPFSAQLYEGSVVVNAQVVDGNGQNSYAIDKQIKGIQIQPLLKDLADTQLIAGTTNLSFKASGRGLTLSKIKKMLNGAGSFEVLDGALYGINIPQKIRSAKATLGGGSDDSEGDSEQKTDFTALTGQFNIANGIVDNTALNMSAPFVRLDGKGLANIIDSTLDYHLKATLVGTSKGQGGASGSDLAGLAIPLKIKGSFDDPKFSLDTSGALKAKLDQEKDKAKDKLKSKLKDKLKGKLGGLFN